MADISPGGLVALGVIVGLLSTCVQSVGLTLQRKSHMTEDEKEEHIPRRPPYRRRQWQIGMLLFLLANIVGSSIQITTLPLPLLSTLQASGLVFNSILATLLLKEPWTRRTGVGTVLVAGGAVLISFFSALPEPAHSLQQLLVLFREPSFLVWFILSLLFVVAVLVMDFSLRKCISQQRAESPRIRLVRGMSYGLISGVLSAHALLLAKSAVELIVTSVKKKTNQFSGYQSWLMLLAFLVMALSQLYYLHLGLKLISTSILYPFVFCIYNIVAILDGLIYFRQMDRLPSLHAGLIALGTVVLLSGVLALSWRLHDEEDAEHPEMAQSEIPQTLLTPGLGFAADPADDDTNESAVASEDESEDEDERRALLSRPRIDTLRASGSRSSRSPRSPQVSRRRKRAATLKELSVIWHELGDEEEQAYGTFGDSGNANARPSSAGHQRQRRHRRLSSGQSLENDVEEAHLEGSLQRSKTAPTKRRSTSGKRRRKSGHEGGALFSELLKKDWWRGKSNERDEDEEDHVGELRPPKSAQSRSRSGGRRVVSSPHP